MLPSLLSRTDAGRDSPDAGHPIAGILSDNTCSDTTLLKYGFLNGSPPLNDSDQHNNDGDDKQDMDKITHRIAGDQPQQPQNYQYYGNCPQHVTLLSDHPFP
jgi:hypothetical protein